MRLIFWIADMIAESDAFFMALMIVASIILLLIGAFVFFAIINWIEKR